LLLFIFQTGFILFTGLRLQFSFLCFPCSWDNRCAPPYLACFWDSVTNFCLRWPKIMILPFLPPKCWDCRDCRLYHHALPWFMFLKDHFGPSFGHEELGSLGSVFFTEKN
jgi:hypothetical protein